MRLKKGAIFKTTNLQNRLLNNTSAITSKIPLQPILKIAFAIDEVFNLFNKDKNHRC